MPTLFLSSAMVERQHLGAGCGSERLTKPGQIQTRTLIWPRDYT